MLEFIQGEPLMYLKTNPNEEFVRKQLSECENKILIRQPILDAWKAKVLEPNDKGEVKKIGEVEKPDEIKAIQLELRSLKRSVKTLNYILS